MKKQYLYLAIVLLTGLVIVYYTNGTENRSEPPKEPIETPSAPIEPSVKAESKPKPKSTVSNSPMSKTEKSLFQIQLDETFSALPTKEDVKGHPLKNGELPSPVVLEGGRLLGTVVQSLRNNPSQIPEALPFFQTCAQDDRLATAIRASCLRKLKDFAKESPTSYQVRNEDFPKRIVRISEKLPKTK